MRISLFFFISIFLLLISCGSGGDSVPPPPGPVCFQMTNSPDFDISQLTDFTIIEPLRELDNFEFSIMAETYNCLESFGLINTEENQCLFNDLDNIQILIVDGTHPADAFACDGTLTQGGCIRDETIILEDNPPTGDDSLVHLTCLRASHLTIGLRSSPDHPWFLDGPGDSIDCICEEEVNSPSSSPVMREVD